MPDCGFPRLIELEHLIREISAESVRDKNIHHAHISHLHIWWARRPVAASRAVIFAQSVVDLSAFPDLFSTEKIQEQERQRLFQIIESWRRPCMENADHPRRQERSSRHRPHLPRPLCPWRVASRRRCGSSWRRVHRVRARWWC